MNIYDKFPMKFVRWAVDNGMNITLNKEYIDLNTGMKSHCHLYYEDGHYVAKMRYDEEKVIETFSDLYYAVRDCEHGREFMSGSIVKLYDEGFGDTLTYEEFA